MKKIVIIFSAILLIYSLPVHAQVVCGTKGTKFLPGTIKKNAFKSFLSAKNIKQHNKYKKFCNNKAKNGSFSTAILHNLVGSISTDSNLCSQVNNPIAPELYIMPNGRDTKLGAYGSSKSIKASDFCFDSSINENPGEATDKKGKYLGFINVIPESSSCGDSVTTVNQLYAAVRNNTSSKLIEVRGVFDGPAIGNIECTAYFKKSDSLLAAWCTKNKKPVSIAHVSSCKASSQAAYQYPSFFKGHWGFIDPSALHDSCINATPSQSNLTQVAISPDCSPLKNTGFNAAVLNITHVIDAESKKGAESPLRHWQIRNMALSLRKNGIAPVLVPDFVVKQNGQVLDGYEAFIALAADSQFQSYLRAQVLSYAKLATDLSIPYFAPVMEIDKMQAGFSNGSSWSQQILPEIRALYAGKVMWIAGVPDLDINLNARGYDILGFNSSPLDDQSVSSYESSVSEGSQRLKDICAAQSIKECFITAAGIWGTSMNGPIWSENYPHVFRIATQQTDAKALNGLMIFDGKNNGGELSLKLYPDLLSNLASYFTQR